MRERVAGERRRVVRRDRRRVAAAAATAAWLLGAFVAAAEAAGDADKIAKSARILELTVRDRYELDGSVERRQSSTVELLDAQAVAIYSQIGLPFSENDQVAEVTRIVVVKPGGRDLDLLADAPRDVAPLLPPSLPIYSDLRLLRHAVPSLAVGDRLTFETRVRAKPVALNRVWNEYTLQPEGAAERQLYELDLPDPNAFHLHVRGDLVADFEEERAGGRWIRRWRRQGEVVTPAPADTPPAGGDDAPAAASESKPAAEPGQRRADFQLTSFASWDELAAWWNELAPVDPDRVVRAKARELTAGLDGAAAKLAALHRFVAREIRYLSLPLGLGRFQPRDPAEVLRTGLGDCKDKHHLLASLAAVAGISVDPVLVHANGRELDDAVASPTQFDHVVSRARLGSDVIWMDATSEMTPMGRLQAGLRGLRGLAVSAGDGGAARGEIVPTLAELPFESRVETATVGVLEAAGPIRAKVRWTFHGDDEALRLAFKYGNAETRRAVVERYRGEWEDEAKIGSVTFGAPEALETPFWFEYEVEWTMKASIWRKAWDLWVPVPHTWIEEPPEKSDTADELDLDNPRRQVRTARLELPPGVRASAPVPVSVERDFATYRSSYRIEGNALVLERELVRKTDKLPRAKFPELAALRKVIADDRVQEFDFAAAPHLAAAEVESADSLESQGDDLYAKKRYDEAAAAYRRATELDPVHGSAWGELGLALYRLERYDDAAAALARQIEIDPFHERAYYDLAQVAWKQRDYAAAERHYRKQIEVTPLDAYSHGQLGELLRYQQRDAEAEELLARAVKLDPEDLDWNEGLLLAYLGNRRIEPALDLLSRRPELPRELDEHLRAARTLLYQEKAAIQVSRFAPWIERLGRSVASALERVDDLAPSEPLAVAATAVGIYWEASGRVALEQGRHADAVALLRAALRVTQGSSAASFLAAALRHQGASEEADLMLAMATTMDRRGSSLYGKQFAAAVPAAAARAALENRSRDEFTLLRSIFRQVPAAPPGDGRLLLLFEVDGRLLRAEPIDGDGGAVLARNLAAEPPRIAVPPGNTTRVVFWALTYCGETGSCTLVLEPPVQAWFAEVAKREKGGR